MQNIPIFLKVDSTTCTIMRQTIDPDHDLGASPGEYVIFKENVICTYERTQSIGKVFGGPGREISEQGASDMATFKLLLLSTEDIISGDRVIVGGMELAIVDVISFSTHKEVIGEKR